MNAHTHEPASGSGRGAGPAFLPAFLPAPGPSDHKYTRGVVALATGSEAYPGAALLGTEAAARCGVGMVRYAGPGSVAAMVVQRVPEAVPAPGRSQAWVLGSGWDVQADDGRAAAERFALVTQEAASTSPDAFFVLDAGVLSLIGGFKDGAEHAILTPHAGEAEELLVRLDEAPGGASPWSRERIERESVDAAVRLAELSGATVALKGHVTAIAAPGTEPVQVEAPTSRLATAGTGDVLAGMIGGIVGLNHARLHRAASAGERGDLVQACAAAVELHGWSALHAARRGAAQWDTARCDADRPHGSRPDLGQGADPVGAHAPILAHDVARAAPAVIARYTAADDGGGRS